MPQPYADLDDLRRDLAEQLVGLAPGEFVHLSYQLPPDRAPTETRRGRLWRRREVRVPSPEEYFAQALALPDGWLTVQLSGSTYAGGLHPTDADGHRSIQALGWRVSGDPDFPDHTGGIYSMRWPASDAEGLAIGIVEALRVLGARPDVAWELTRER